MESVNLRLITCGAVVTLDLKDSNSVSDGCVNNQIKDGVSVFGGKMYPVCEVLVSKFGDPAINYLGTRSLPALFLFNFCTTGEVDVCLDW